MALQLVPEMPARKAVSGVAARWNLRNPAYWLFAHRRHCAVGRPAGVRPPGIGDRTARAAHTTQCALLAWADSQLAAVLDEPQRTDMGEIKCCRSRSFFSAVVIVDDVDTG